MFRDLKRKAAEKAASLKGDGEAPADADAVSTPDDAPAGKRGLSGRLASARDAVTSGAEKIESTRRKVAAAKTVAETAVRVGKAAQGLKEKAAAAGGVAAAGTDSLKRAKGRFMGTFKSPHTREDKTLTGKKVVFLCARCERETGSLRKNRWDATLKSMKSTTKAGWGAFTGSPSLIMSGGADAVGSLVGRGDSPRKKADQFLSQCGYCGEWVCGTCWDEAEDGCHNCTG